MAEETKSEPPLAPFNVESVAWTEWSQGVRYGSRYRPLSNTRKTAMRIGVAVEELPPGKQSCPFHYHMLEEEHLLMLEGELVLRLGEDRHVIKAGDYCGFPAGRKVGHCLINESDKPARFVMIGDRNPNEVCVYPDSDKMAVDALGLILRGDAKADYWDGERADEPVKRGEK